MKRFLGNRGVKDEILHFDGSRIGPDTRKNVMKLLKQKGASFEQANIQRVSSAAAPLAAWVKANVRYSIVLEKIQPLTTKLEDAKRNLDQYKDRLTQCETELAEIDRRAVHGDDSCRSSCRAREARRLLPRALRQGEHDAVAHDRDRGRLPHAPQAPQAERHAERRLAVLDAQQ